MSNYPLTKVNEEGTLLNPIKTFYSNEYADDTCALHLRSEVHDEGYGDLHTYYRLRANKAHNIESALRYNIRCPECSVGMLKQVGRCINSHELGLYVCPICERNHKR